MNKKQIYIYALFFLLLWQTVSYAANTSYSIQWKGVETWNTDSVGHKVIAFEDAVYPSAELMPHVEIVLPTTNQVNVVAPEFTTVTADEREILQGWNIPQTLKVSSTIVTERGNNLLDILIFPFIEENGVYKKLIKYQLAETKTANAQKIPAASIHSYASRSVLASGTFVKIKVSSTGIYRLTYEDLQSMGITPANVRIFGYGGAMLNQSFLLEKQDDLPEVAIYMNKGSDDVFNAGDYILFYAQGPVSWKYNSGYFTHTTNVYSNYGYYFVTSDAGTGKKIEVSTDSNDATNAISITTFIDYKLHEQDLINLIDRESGANGGGREFYGELFSTTLSYDFSFNFPNIITDQNISCRIGAAATSSRISSFYLSLNGGQSQTLNLAALSTTDHYTRAIDANKRYNFTPAASNTQTFTVKYIPSTSSSMGYLNYLEVSAYRKLYMSGNTMFFRNPSNIGSSQNSLYKLANATTNTKVWNITDPSNIYEVNATLNGDTLQFVEASTSLQEYVAVDISNSGSIGKPETVGTIGNQNLHGLEDIDFVIITNPDFLAQAQALAEAHETIDGMTTAVVTSEQVYNEFSSGTPDATAYRWIMKMLYDRATQNPSLRMPGYLLLFGDGTFDNRKILTTSGENKLLTYQAINSVSETAAYCTDDYFGFLDDNEGTSDTAGRMDIGVGRFPANTTTQATNIVEKTIRYMKDETKSKWKNQLCFLADDGDKASHASDVDYAASAVAAANPAFQINKIYLDAYLQEVTASGEAYPLAKNTIDNLLSSGVLYFDYCGHGSPNGVTNEGMITIKEIQKMSNTNLGLWMLATCSFSKFDAHATSAGEEALLNSVGGAIGVFSACRTVYASNNRTLNKNFSDSLFASSNGEYIRVGDAIRKAKNKTGSEANKLAYVFLGDPAIRLSYPNKYDVKTTYVNNKSVSTMDTLRALSTAVIQGYVAEKATQTKATNFNGTLQVTIQDKKQTVTTLDNHKELEDTAHFQYQDRTNTLFSGKVNVVNGEFTLAFMLPKDIKYNYGTGRIIYYTNDTTTDEDGNGYFEDFVIGGSNDSLFTDNAGPDVQIYLNSRAFVSGGKVNERPQFIADILDENGINTVGSGIGHDLMLVVDDDPEQSYILNEYFTAATNSFIQGSVTYKLPELEAGKHTLTFRAWDLLNNSTTKTLNFEVVTGLKPVILSVRTYPNPAQVSDQVRVSVSHDRPETILETVVTIFDMSGRKVWSFTQTGADDITWNIKDTNISAGVYLYQIRIKTQDSDYTSKTEKMIILN